MASTDNAAQYDLPFIKLVYEFLPKDLMEKTEIKTIYEWAKMGLIQRDRLVEIAMANASNGKYKVVSEDGRDHCDGSDTKTVTINYRVTGRRNIIVTNISNKIGSLRIVAYDSKIDKFYFYYIFDFESVRNYNRLEFSVSSSSKYNNDICGKELYSFEDLAKYGE